MSRISNKPGAKITAPPLPHEVDLVAPPVLTQPSLPGERRQHSNLKWICATVAITMVSGSFAVFATLTVTTYCQLSASPQATPKVESVAESVTPRLDRNATEVLTPVAFSESTALEPKSVPPNISNEKYDELDELFDELSRPAEQVAVGQLFSPHVAEETSCPAEDASQFEPLLALMDIEPDPWVDETGGITTGLVDCGVSCDVEFSTTPVSAQKCENGTCPAPGRFTDPRSFGTKLVFAENMKQARELAVDQGKLLFVMHVSGNFAIEGFT